MLVRDGTVGCSFDWSQTLWSHFALKWHTLTRSSAIWGCWKAHTKDGWLSMNVFILLLELSRLFSPKFLKSPPAVISLLTYFSHLGPCLAPVRLCRWRPDICNTLSAMKTLLTLLNVAECALPSTDSSHDSPWHCWRQHQHDCRLQENITGARQHSICPPFNIFVQHKPHDVRGVVGCIAHHKHSQCGQCNSQGSSLPHRAQIWAPHQGNAAQRAKRRHNKRQKKQDDGHLQA